MPDQPESNESIPDFQPSLSATEWMMDQRRALGMNVIQGMQRNPDDAARAVQLGTATGVDPSTVYGNLEDFERNHKAALAESLVNSNSFLRSVAESHPLASTLAQDDWGQLAKVGDAASRMKNESDIQYWVNKINEYNPVSGFARGATEGFQQGFGDAPLRGYWDPTSTYPMQADIELANRILSGTAGAMAMGIGRAAESIAGTKAGSWITGATMELLDWAGTEGGAKVHMGEPGAAVVNAIAEARGVAQVAKPFIDAGITPPLGIHPVIDKMWIEQAEADLKNLQELQSESAKSTLRERAPDIFEQAIGRQLPQTIGVKAEAIRKLYGDKPIQIGDGLLGDAGNVAEQLILAEAHGGDIEIPMAKWLSRVEPETQKALADDIRLRPQAPTINEAKEIQERVVPTPTAGEGTEPKPTETKPVPAQSSDPLDLARTSVGTRTSTSDWPFLPARSGLGGAESIVPADTARMTTFKDSATGLSYQSEGSFPAAEGLAKIQSDNIHSPVIKATMDFFGDVLHRLAGDVMVHVVPDAIMNKLERDYSKKYNVDFGANAFYDPQAHHIIIRDSIANGSKHGHEYAASTLTEEVAHAATVREMRNDKALYNRISMLRQHTIDWLTQNNADRLKYHEYELSNNEEFVAWAWKSDQRFRDTLSKIPVSPTMRRTFGFNLQGLANAWDVFRELYRKLLTNIAGKAPPESVLDALLRMGPEFERSNALMRIRKGEPEQLGPRTPTPEVDPILERIKAYGMNAKRAENYRKLVEKSNAEDAKWQLQQGEKRERKLQSDQWKADTAQMRQDVEVDLKRRPDHAADRLLRLGEFSGQKVKRVSLDKSDLTPEQIASLPDGYFKLKNKVSAQALANAVGFTTPEQLIESLAKLHANREAAGMNPAQYLKSLVDSETQRQMQLVHGDLEQNIIHDAQEHVLGASSLDVTHEELIALAERAGVQALDKDGIKTAAKAEFDKQTIENISREKYQAAAQKHAQAVEDELAKGDKADAREALQRKGQQVVALHLAKFAKDLEKRLKADEKLRKSLAKTEPSGIDPEYAVWAQDILSRTGTFVKRTLQGMERQKDLVSDSGSLREFVDQVNSASNIWQDENSGGFSLPVPDFLMDPSYRKPVSKMSVAEFDSVATALKAINGIGRDIRSFVVKGEKVALEDVQNGLIERMKAFYRDREVDPAKAHAFQQIGTWLLNPETWFNKLDLFDPRGPFNQLLIRPVVEGSYDSLALRKEMAKDWKAVATFEDANKTLPDSPLMWKGKPIPMTKQNAYVILANMGNELQRKKLAGGYGVKDVQDIWNWLGNVLTKEDMDRQAKIGQFWEKWFGRAEEMYAKLHGWIPDRIELGQVQTPWGMYNEWYHPLIKDPAKFVEGGKIGDVFDDSGYFRPAPGNVYARKRTGAIYPIDLTFRGVVARAEQIANDIAMRPPITQVSKIILSGKFKQAMTDYMGPAYQKAIEPWLRDSAGQYRRPDIDGNLEKVMNYIRQNLSTLMIGANLGTFFKHTPTALAFSVKEVGGKDFLDSFLHMFHETDTGQARWRFAFEHSQELPNRLHFARESMGSINEDIFKRINWDSKFFRARDIIQSIGAAPVAMGDMLSALPMWDAKYRQLRTEGLEHGDAVYEADQAVRRTHGSTIVANRAALLRKGGLWGFITPFYNFFNNALQRNYEYGWQAKLSMEGRTLPEMTGFEQAEFKLGFNAVPGILGGLLIYGIVPSIIEQVVDPLPRDKKESAWWYWSKSLLHAPVSMIPGVRDVVNGLMAGRETDVGLFGSAGNDVSEPLKVNWIRNPDKAFRGVVDAFGAATGLTFHSEGNLGEYIINLERGKEHIPKGIGDVVSILRHGTLKEKRR